MSEVIRVENLSKLYRLGVINTGTFSQDFERWLARIRKKEDPFLKVASSNNRLEGSSSDIVYSLRDVSFSVSHGETLGIIGRNGAGKSTLLKILSRITSPSNGSVKIRGRVASLLEVGTGFHPELTGRENIFLNGAILGMRKTEIKQKLDEIIEFSGVGKYVDTPVKRYSSGMYVRLAFAVAAHLEPEILIVDEVLAVGDMEFQKKCLGKMKEVSNEGRTVLFVSHNMAAVKSLCRSAILLKHGEMVMQGDASEVVAAYLGYDKAGQPGLRKIEPIVAEEMKILDVFFKPVNANEGDEIVEESGAELVIDYDLANTTSEVFHFTFHLKNDEGDTIFGFSTGRDNVQLQTGVNRLVCRFPDFFLNSGTYFLDLMVIKSMKKVVCHEKDIVMFNVVQKPRPLGAWYGREPGFLIPSFNWKYDNAQIIQ
jgi:lipopolysaccharide transport system ATP-binding protein